MGTIYDASPDGKNAGFNPFVKVGDVVYLNGKSGRYRIVEVGNDYFKAIYEPPRKNETPIIYKWNEFKRWSFR